MVTIRNTLFFEHVFIFFFLQFIGKYSGHRNANETQDVGGSSFDLPNCNSVVW